MGINEDIKRKENLKKRPYMQCYECKEVLLIETNFYKTKSFFQGRCKRCSNKKRLDYPIKNYYKKKVSGFQSLPEELQKKIIYDIYIRLKFVDIYKKYKNEFPSLKYHNLINWHNTNKIPDYQPIESN